jgi:hypothetical protein
MAKLAETYDEEEYPLEIDVPFHDEDGTEDTAYFEIANLEQLMKINRLAAEFYASHGYKFMPEFDFFGSSHPQEHDCFVRACLAFYLVSSPKH